MLSVLFWGTGKNAFNWIIYNKGIFDSIESKKFIDRKKVLNIKKTFFGFEIIEPDDISESEYDYICILSTFKSEIIKEAIEVFKIKPEKLISEYELENIVIKNKFAKKNIYLMEDKLHIFDCIENDISIGFFINYITENDLLARKTFKNYYFYKILREKYYDFACSCASKFLAGGGKEISNEKNNIIWFCWLQGIKNMPPIVSKCFENLKKLMYDIEIILVTEDNYSLYIDFPEIIIQKYKRKYITKTHFSDLLRIELLIKYGGIWIDATVFLTKRIPRFVLDASLFVFKIQHNPAAEPRVASNWFIKAKPQNRILLLTRELLYKYHSENVYVENYFLFHYFFRISTDIYSYEWKELCNIKINSSILYDILFNEFDIYKWNFIKQISFCQKLSYKFSVPDNIKNTFYEKLINGELF